MVLVVLPALLKLFPTKGSKAPEADVQRWRGFSQLLVRFSRPVHLACWVVGICATAGLYYFQTETRVIRNFADDSRLIRDYRFIEENLAGISTVETIIKFDKSSQKSLRFLQRMEVVRQVADSVRKHSHVSGAVCLSDFQPVRVPPEETAGTREKILYNRRSSETEKRIKSAKTPEIRQFLAVAKEAADLNRSGDNALNSEGDELWRITAQVPALADVNYAQLTRELNQAVQEVTKYHAGVGHVVTGTVPLFMRTQQALLDSLIQSFGLAFLTIAITMMFAVKDVIAGALSMIPNVLPIAAVFGAVSWAGLRIDIGTMVTASVALGLAVDACLHLLTWFRTGIRNGLSRDEAIVECLVHCGPAMLQTTAGISLAMLVLYPSDLVMISRFGWLMAALIAAAYIGDVILLPVMLRGALGQRIEKAVHAELAAARAAEEAAAKEALELQLAVPEEPQPLEVIPPPHLTLEKASSRRKRNAG
jgi:predicted RND superfamily exporter protein